MPDDKGQDEATTALWHNMLTSGDVLNERRFRNLFSKLPHDPRCKLCNAPYKGLAAPLMRAMGRKPSNLTPNLCDW